MFRWVVLEKEIDRYLENFNSDFFFYLEFNFVFMEIFIESFFDDSFLDVNIDFVWFLKLISYLSNFFIFNIWYNNSCC